MNNFTDIKRLKVLGLVIAQFILIALKYIVHFAYIYSLVQVLVEGAIKLSYSDITTTDITKVTVPVIKFIILILFIINIFYWFMYNMKNKGDIPYTKVRLGSVNVYYAFTKFMEQVAFSPVMFVGGILIYMSGKEKSVLINTGLIILLNLIVKLVERIINAYINKIEKGGLFIIDEFNKLCEMSSNEVEITNVERYLSQNANNVEKL